MRHLTAHRRSQPHYQLLAPSPTSLRCSSKRLRAEPWNGFAYNYDGVPEYAASDFEDTFDHEYRTVIGCFLYGGPPEQLVDADGAWELRATFLSSGEAECPLRAEIVAEERCRLCDETRGEPHGYIYLGDGWAEAVYRRQTRDEDCDDEFDG
jgi:hypothetical protein